MVCRKIQFDGQKSVSRYEAKTCFHSVRERQKRFDSSQQT
jgi:hypothetical protein